MPVRRSRRRRRHSPVQPIRKTASPLLETAVATGAVTLGIAALAPSADAATFQVTNLNNSGAGSLRQAVIDANTTPGPDVITFQAGLTGTITLTSGQLVLYDSVDIQGPGAAALTVSGNNASRVFYIYSSNNAPLDISMSGFTVANGNDATGGGIVDFSENLTLTNMVVSNNTSNGPGGGVAKFTSNGTLHIHNSTISGNNAIVGAGVYIEDVGAPADIQDSVISGNNALIKGGGIYLYGPNYDVSIIRTTISGNSAAAGGGIYLYDTDGGQFIIDSSTISGNTATYVGGGIYFYNPDDPITIINSTISGNQAKYAAGISFYYTAAPVTISFSTITANTASVLAGGIGIQSNMPLTLNDSIIGGNNAPTDPDVTGGTFILNYSLLQNPGSATVTQNAGAIVGVSPQLGPLANNGGPTQTHLPAITSPVVDAGDPAFTPPPAKDQRGFNRVSGPRVDMGAVELNGGTMQFSSATYSVNENAGSVTITVTRAPSTDPASVHYATSDGTAMAGADYTATSGTLTFASGQTSATFNVPILDDAIVEGNETFNVTLSNPVAGFLGAQSTAVVTIVDVENGRLQLSSATYSGNEGTSVVVTVNRVNGANGPVSVNYTTSNGTGSAGTDYTTTSGTLNWADGDSAPKTFSVPILVDAPTGSNETFNVALSAPTGGAVLGAPTTATVTIVETAGAIDFTSPNFTAFQKDGFVTLTLERVGGSSGTITVQYATSNGTATAGHDFVASSGTVTFGNGETTKTITIPLLQEVGPAELAETFTVTLSNPSAGSLGPNASAAVTLAVFGNIPVLSTLGKLFLAAFSALAGLFMIDRKRFFGIILAALLAGVFATSSLQAQRLSDVKKPAATADHDKHKRPNRSTGVLQSVATTGGVLAMTLVSGDVIRVPVSKVMVVDLRGKHRHFPSVASLAPAMHLTIVVKKTRRGAIEQVKVKIVNP